MENVCIVCGDPIPEGRQVCPACERQQHLDPCKACTRHGVDVNCHATCQTYLDWKAYQRKVREWLAEKRGHNSHMASQRFIANVKWRARGWKRRGGSGDG